MKIFRIIHWTELPREEESKLLMQDELFREYVQDNGWHFTCELSDFASRHLENEDGTEHNWTTKQVKDAFSANKLSKGGESTWGDVSYAANMAYANFYPKLLKNESDCLTYASMVSTDPDGYDGIVFSRWIADYIGKGMDLDWDLFV